MVLRKVLGLGVEADTLLFDPDVQPGGDLAGKVRLQGGSADHDVQEIALALVCRYHRQTSELFRATVAGPFVLAAGAAHTVPFRIALPADTPLTVVRKRPFNYIEVQLRTELALAGAVDKTDSDPLVVRAAPVQSRIIDALYALGYRCWGVDGGQRPQILTFEEWHRRGAKRVPLDLAFTPGEASTEVAMRVAAPSTKLSVGDAVGGLVAVNLGLFTGSKPGPVFAPAGAGPELRSEVDHAWLDEELDWESWVKERITALTASR